VENLTFFIPVHQTAACVDWMP